MILAHYERYIAGHSKRPLYDEYGNRREIVDPEIQQRIEEKLMLGIIYKFDCSSCASRSCAAVFRPSSYKNALACSKSTMGHLPAVCHRSQDLWFLPGCPAPVPQNKGPQFHFALPPLCIVWGTREFFRRYTVRCVLPPELLRSKFSFLRCAGVPGPLFRCTARIHHSELRRSLQAPPVLLFAVPNDSDP